jgi:hypothetical protein
LAERPEKQKLSHQSVDYEHPSTHPGEFCGRCRHLIVANPPRCEGVKSPIHPADWCHRFRNQRLVQISGKGAGR